MITAFHTSQSFVTCSAYVPRPISSHFSNPSIISFLITFPCHVPLWSFWLSQDVTVSVFWSHGWGRLPGVYMFYLLVIELCLLLLWLCPLRFQPLLRFEVISSETSQLPPISLAALWNLSKTHIYDIYQDWLNIALQGYSSGVDGNEIVCRAVIILWKLVFSRTILYEIFVLIVPSLDIKSSQVFQLIPWLQFILVDLWTLVVPLKVIFPTERHFPCLSDVPFQPFRFY